MSATKSNEKDIASQQSAASAEADENIQAANEAAAAARIESLPTAEAPAQSRLGGEARAVLPESPKSPAEAQEFMQQFGAVPSGWIFEPATGLRKA